VPANVRPLQKSCRTRLGQGGFVVTGQDVTNITILNATWYQPSNSQNIFNFFLPLFNFSKVISIKIR
jgi:hypothetical protein